MQIEKNNLKPYVGIELNFRIYLKFITYFYGKSELTLILFTVSRKKNKTTVPNFGEKLIL
ncbi:hypothetical protein EG359_00880 [Chryseobacterium joostei]|uniref:Uncharacterized protein n=1 Tax=Chryseobacterium joostei TaxID=112234 RepID=A0ABN5S5P1_9FLAO|nr:hypothetical protein EG359_00880 [Chryseobacterium joostei]HCM35664.1 hypothetical protein [Chryseobacterium sp.]